MSRSFKTPVSNTTWIRIPCCVVSHSAMSKWKRYYNRVIRRHNNCVTKNILHTGDIDMLDKIIYYYKKTFVADPWGGPGDGWYYNRFTDYQGYMK